MAPPVLQRPIGMLCEQVQPISSENSLRLAAERFRTEGPALIPVFENERIAGVIDESDLAKALATGFEPNAPVNSIPYTQVPMLLAATSGAEALRVFVETNHRAVVVVDQAMSLVGVLTPAHLYPHTLQSVRPRSIGGMATPQGVYLTTGAQGAGATPFALFLTGATMLGLFMAADLVSGQIGRSLTATILPKNWIEIGVGGLSGLLFMVGLRSLPLAGYHAAEHMVVHAIERGEDLEPDIVRRMPRVHPRCGTNLAVAITLFLSISMAPWIAEPELRVLVALLATLFFWQPLGSFVQYYFTTRPPNRKQLEAGIKAGRDLLKLYHTNPIVTPTPWGRLKSSGILWVILGSTLTGLAMTYLAQWLGFGHIIRVS